MGKSDGKPEDDDLIKDENQDDLSDEELEGGDDEDLEDEDDEDGGDEENEDEDGAETDGSFEVELREDEDGSPPEVTPQAGIRKRINKLNQRNSATKGLLDESDEENENLKTQNQLLKLQIEQLKDGTQTDRKPENLPPDPNTFDDGASDPQYVDALHAYNKGYVDRLLNERAEARSQIAVSPARQEAQERHYERVDALDYPEYDKDEDIVRGILGQEPFNLMIENLDKVHLIVPHLARSPDEARAIAKGLTETPIRTVAALGALGASLKPKKSRRKTMPSPDTDTSGSRSGTRRKQNAGPEGATYE